MKIVDCGFVADSFPIRLFNPQSEIRNPQSLRLPEATR